jgi:hypothetical protein
MKHLVVTLLALIACDGRREHPKRQLPAGVSVSFNGRDINAKPSGTPRPQSKLTVTLDGKPLAMATALAWPVPNSRGVIELTVSSVPLSCDDVTGKMRPYFPNETRFQVGIKDGMLVTTGFGNHGQSDPHAVPTTGDGTPGQPTTADVDFEIDNEETPAHHLTVKGTIDALGCPAPPP